MNRLEQKYKEVVTPSLMKKFNYKSVMEVPHVDKIVINMGIGEAISNQKCWMKQLLSWHRSPDRLR